MLLIGRFFRFVIFVLGVALGVVGTLFAVGNPESIAVSIGSYGFHVQVYALALVPLGVGLAVGWLYTVPARAHEFAGHWRSWRQIRRMQRENKELRRSLDTVLELPDDAAAKPQPELEPRAAETAAVTEAAPAGTTPIALAELETVALAKRARAFHRGPARVSAAQPEGKPDASIKRGGRGHRSQVTSTAPAS